MKKLVITILICLSFAGQSMAQATDSKQKSREFLVACTYGILTGTLVGAASLAFTDSPGDNLHRVARGASLGLYAGIALGYYINNLDEAPPEDYNYPEGDIPIEPQSGTFQLLPILDKADISGLELRWMLKRF